MRIVKQIQSIYLSSIYIEPESKLGIFLSELKSRIKKETDFINYISSIKFWDFNKVSLWSFEEVLNYIDEILEKYSIAENEEINNNILLPLIKFILLLIKNCYNKEIFASFDNLQKIYLTCLNIEIKILIIEINLLLVESKHSLIIINKLFYRTLSFMVNFEIILMDFVHNNFTLNQGIINILEQIMNNLYRKWTNLLKRGRPKLTEEENKLINDVVPFNIFHEIIFNKKNYKNPENFKGKIFDEYSYFRIGYEARTPIYEKNLEFEKKIKYLLKDEINYIISMNNFFFIVNEIVQISINPEENKDKIISITKFILLGLNLYMKNNLSNFDDDNINIISENYIQNYYHNILTIVTSPNFSLKLKSTFLKSGIYFMVVYDGYDNILFENGLFHSFLNDLTHQNENEMEVLTEKEGNDQEFLNVILKFVFNFKIFKEIPQNFFVKILEQPKDKIYPYLINNVVFALKKRKIFDENLVKNIIMPRLIYELENIEIPSDELKYNFNTEEKITINQRNLLIDRLFLVLIKIFKKSTNSSLFGNFELNLVETFKKIFDIKNNKNLLTNIDFLPSIINLIYFYIKICNCFPSKIPTFINNDIFNLSIEFFSNYFPKCDGGMNLVFFMLYIICIHNDGKEYIKNNLEKIKILFENIFEKLNKNENYFFYNLFVLKDINKYELFSPCSAFIHLEGISEIIKIIFSELKKFMENMHKELTEIKIEKSTNIKLSQNLFFIETKRTFIDEFFLTFNEKTFESFKKNNIDVDIVSIFKLYLDILINPITLYSFRSNFIVLKWVILLAKNYPEFTMNKIYDKYNEILNNNFDLEKIQIYKMISSLQKIIETIFTSLYQKSEDINFLNIADKYSFLYAKFITKYISLNSKLSFYINTLDDRQLLLNSKYCIKLLSKDKDPQFRDMLVKISYKILSKLLPRMTNPNLLIIDEDNYLNVKCPIELNQNTYLEILSGSFFVAELFKQENKIFNSLLASVDFFCVLGKKTKTKALCNFQMEDISRIKNYIKLGFIFSNIIKYFYENVEIKSNTDDTIKNILIYIFLFNYMNMFLYGKMDKDISSIVFYYFIKYNGIKNIFKITKRLLFFCKEDYAKKELPIIEIILIKSLWNTIIGALLLLIKYSFYLHDNFYTLLILENNLAKNFTSMKEFDAWVKFLILNNFVEVFFDKNDCNYNINIIKDLETYCNELTRTIFILFDNCCRMYYEIDNIKNEKINLNELFEKGYFSYEIMQVIQEGKFTNDAIIKAIDEYRQNEIDNENEKNKNDNMNEEKEKDKYNEKNKYMEEEKEKEKEKEENNEIQNINIVPINDINPEKKEKKEKLIKKTINKTLSSLEKINIENDESFLNNIYELFPQSKIPDKDENNIINYTKDIFLNSLLSIYSTLENCYLSFRKINEMKKMNIKYRIKSFEKKEDLLPYLKQLLDIIKKNQENNNNNEEEKTKKELTYLMFMNYSIIRYKTLTNFYETVDINKYIDFIYENNLIENSSNAIKELMYKKEKINLELKKKLIYEHFLRIYILFCFLGHNKKNFEKEKKIFLDSFFYLINESKNNEIYVLNEPIMILCLQIINEFFNSTDKSQEILYEYLYEKKMFEKILELKFNKIDAMSKLDENQLKYFVTLEECFKQFIFKIFSEKNLFCNLLRSIFKYIFANINPENDEIELDNFIDLCSDYIKIDNCDIFINSIKAYFDIIEKEEKNNNKIYLVRLKQENRTELEKLKEEIKKGEAKIKEKNKENNGVKDNIEDNFEEKMKNTKFNWSERNKYLFNILLNHICKTSELINEDIIKREKYQKFSRNYLFDLDTTLSGLNCILHAYPSFINLLFLFNYKENPENNFIKYLIKKIFPILNYYHFCISWPNHITYKEDLDNNFLKERKNSLRCYNNTPNSYQSYFEYFRNVNIIASIIHSITYKRRNMNEIELMLINECRNKILNEINLILIDVDEKQKIKNDDFDLLNKNDDLLSINVIYFKSCITILFSMSEFIDSSDIFSQFDAFEIANLIFSKKYNIIKSITNILKNMKLDEKNEKFHQIGIKYLNQLFKFIKIKKQKKQRKETINNNNSNNNNIEDNKSIISNKSKKKEEDLLAEFLEESSEENEGLYTEELNIIREEEEIEDEEEEENEDPENLLNDVEEDLLNLVDNEEEDEDDVDSNELLNNLENPIEANNLNLQIIQNEEENEEEEENNNNLINGERIFGIHNVNVMNLDDNYNEENILFYEYNTEVMPTNLNKQRLKAEEFQFYEDFIIFPFLLFRTNSKNELIYFNRAKINVDIFCNLDKSIVNKANNMFLYYYIFPFDLQYNKYFNFVFTGFKNKTMTGYFNEINKVLSDFMSMFSKNNEEVTKNLCNDILTKLKEDENIIKESYKVIEKESKDKDNLKDKDKNKESEIVEEKSEDIQMIIEKDKEKEKEKEEEEKNEKKEENSGAEFLLELPPDLREEILRDLDPSIIPTLPQEMQNEYMRIISRNNDLNLFPLNLNLNKQQTDIIIGGDNNNNLIKKNYKLRKLRYKRENILKIFYQENNISNANEEENNIILNIFDDQFLENLILYNLKSILSLKQKKPKKTDEYASILKRLIHNENLRYKIIDILLNLWICDTQNIFNLMKNSKIPQKNNYFLNNLFYLFFQLGFSEDYLFNYYENFFIYFAKKYQKYLKKFFLQTSYDENGEYILEEKIYEITPNSKNLKQLLNIKYNKGENVLGNLLDLILVNSSSSLKTIFAIQIFTVTIQNCLKDTNKEKNNIIKENNSLNISDETIHKMLDLFNNFEINLYTDNPQKTNNPTSILIEMINDEKIYQILLDALMKRIISLKESITKEMDDFLTNKKIDIVLFNKIFPDIYLFKLVKFINSASGDFNEKITQLEKNKNENEILQKKNMYKKLKHFIKEINEVLFSCWEQLNNLLFNINTRLKENQELILPKLNRLIPYLETFITLSHLQFISTYSPNLDQDKIPFIFEKNFDSNRKSSNLSSSFNAQPQSPLPLVRLNSKNEVDSFVEFFYEFCEKNKKIINYILRQYPKMFTNELIKKISPLLDLENKKTYFQHSLKKLPANKKCLKIQVRRNGAELFADSFEALINKSPKDIRGNLMIIFENEEAVDRGGVKREWLTILSKEMFNPNYMLFTLAKNGTTYTINSDSGKYNEEHLRHFEFIGRIIAKAIFDGMMLDCYFTRVIYKLISGTPISYHDMEDYDPVYYNSIKWLLENDFTETETFLTYSVNHDDLGQIQTVDLIENGRNVEVTEKNKFDYVQRLCSFKLYESIKLQIEALLKGFYNIIPQNLISIFNHRELELVISGMPTINIQDWKNNTIYENYNEESNVIKYFWKIIESFDNDERAEFLQFVTGSAKVPLEGFCALQGIGGVNKFKISKVFDTNFDRLPTAHTCTNQLDLPDYPTKEILNERLRLAIKEGKNSFGFI